jgi:hypothetical protein
MVLLELKLMPRIARARPPEFAPLRPRRIARRRRRL